jgi:RNA polymerase sigma-70 factor (ECF subfamily)
MANTDKVAQLPAQPAEVTALVERCRRGERDALAQFYRQYRGDVARNLYRVLGPSRDDVEDVVQEVFIEVFRSIGRFRGDSKISTWLYRVCVNVALQRLRKRKRLNEVSPPDNTAEHSGVIDTQTPQRAYEAQERLRAVYRILDGLAPKKRVVFVLHEIEGREPKEIAGIVGAPVLTVRTRLHYARKEFYAAAASDPAFEGATFAGFGDKNAASTMTGESDDSAEA